MNNTASNIGAGLGSLLTNNPYAVTTSQAMAQQSHMAQQAAMFGGAVQVGAQPIEMSDDPDTWNETEVLKMFKWFMKMHHEEDIKGFKAMRDIERSIERADMEEQQRKYWEIQAQAMQAMRAAQTAQTNTLRNIVDDLPLATITKKESWWKKLLK